MESACRAAFPDAQGQFTRLLAALEKEPAHVRVADPVFNTERILALAERASAAEVAIALFPELGVSAYSNEDLFHQAALIILRVQQAVFLQKAASGHRIG